MKEIKEIKGILHLLGGSHVNLDLAANGIELEVYCQSQDRKELYVDGDTRMNISDFLQRYKGCKVRVENSVIVYA